MNGSNTALLTNILASLPAVWDIIIAMMAGFGIFAVIYGIAMAAKVGAPGSSTSGVGAIATIVIGALFVNISFFMNFMSYSIFNTTYSTGLTYRSSQSGSFGLYIDVAMGMISIVGLYSFGRGLWLAHRTSDDKQHFWSAVTHIIGGILAVNIVATISLFGATVGGTVQGLTTLIAG
jgi:hypothetical protein